MLCSHPARTRRRCHTDRPPARLEGQADAAPPAALVQQATPIQQIIGQIKTVLIEVPLCDNPPGLDGTPSFCKAPVNLQLIKSRSPTGRNLLHRLWWGLKETGAKLANDRKVFNRNDAVVWLIEQLQERP
jgi:hypothetical protein